ncbi:MAG: 3-hydroxylacyl-ACP dehydratase [Saprospiraceae bacterium]|nr:3-hydroxylacyl-ACP dehydratase [Saprospiraceae bacterium]
MAWADQTIQPWDKDEDMLLNTFYTVSPGTEMIDSRISATIAFIRESPIFQGHFPQHPVVPGVCMFAMIKEILEKQLDRHLRLSQCRNMKFLKMIDPDQHPTIHVEISFQENEDRSLGVQARLLDPEGGVYFHMTGATYLVKNTVHESV